MNKAHKEKGLSPRVFTPHLTIRSKQASMKTPIRLLTTVVAAILAVAMLGAGQNDPSTRFNRLGHSMMCVCSCNQVLLECNHVGCPDSSAMIGELHDQVDGVGPQTPNAGQGGGTAAGTLAAGSDTAVLNWFVAKYGATVLAAPVRGGFDTVAWVTPLALLVLAIFGTAAVVKLWAARRAPALAGIPHPTLQIDDDLRTRIRRETEL